MVLTTSTGVGYGYLTPKTSKHQCIFIMMEIIGILTNGYLLRKINDYCSMIDSYEKYQGVAKEKISAWLFCREIYGGGHDIYPRMSSKEKVNVIKKIQVFLEDMQDNDP